MLDASAGSEASAVMMPAAAVERADISYSFGEYCAQSGVCGDDVEGVEVQT